MDRSEILTKNTCRSWHYMALSLTSFNIQLTQHPFVMFKFNFSGLKIGGSQRKNNAVGRNDEIKEIHVSVKYKTFGREHNQNNDEPIMM